MVDWEGPRSLYSKLDRKNRWEDRQIKVILVKLELALARGKSDTATVLRTIHMTCVHQKENQMALVGPFPRNQ
jgi:hypothetical protein